MDQEQLCELYNLIKRAYDRSCWDTVQEALDYISEYMDIEEDSTED